MLAHSENGKPLPVSEDEAESWHWADADGVVSIVDEWELLSSLSTGTLPHYTLVWRAHWTQWLPACQVAELANTLPKDKLEAAVAPGNDPLRNDPPPPPVDRYQAYQTREAAAKLLGKRPKAGARVPTAPPTGRMNVAPTPPPPPAPRPAQPTLVESALGTATATLRPPGAVPPPPRGVPTPPPAFNEQALPEAIMQAPPSPQIQMMPPSEEPAPVSVEAPTNPQAALAPLASPESKPLPSWSEDLDAEVRAGARAPARMKESAYSPGPPATAVYRAPAKSPLVWVAVLGLAGLLAVVGIAVLFVVLRGSKDVAAPRASATSSAPAGGGDKTRIVPCKLDKPAARLAPAIMPSIAPVTAALSSGSKFAVGYASSGREAEGITIDPSSLAVERPFRQKTAHDIAAVVPLARGGNLTFTIDEEESGFRSPRSLDSRSRLILGWTDQGLAKRQGAGDPTTIWPSPSDKVTDPRVAALVSGGYAVTVRRGGQGGAVLVGLIDEMGDKKSALTEVGSKPQVGTPAIAASDRGVIVAFAGRPTDDSYWTLQVGTAPPGSTPTSAQSFATPPGGLGADAISPAIEGLPNDRWLLQWTEGAAGRRQVRIQTLGFDLVPVGDPINLSAEEANAGQGVVMVQGEKALSLFLVRRGNTHELWGATLSCP